MARSSLYHTLIGHLEVRLSQLPAGTRLPSEQELAATFAVSKPTLRRALAELAARGLIRKQNGVGSSVAAGSRVISRELIFLCNDLVFFAESLKSFSLAAAAANYLPSILPLTGDRTARERITATAAARRPAGMVVYADPLGSDPDLGRRLAASGIPLLYLIRMPEGAAGSLLAFENADGIAGIVQRFYDGGCRRFALFGAADINPSAAAERTRGFLAGLRKCRLTPRPEWFCLPESPPEARERFYELFRNPAQAPDAVCCLNDFCAGTLIRNLIRRGVNPPGLRISGFDHNPLTAFLPCSILTVEPPLARLGREAAAMLIRQVENPHLGFSTRKLASRLVTTIPGQ